MKNILIALFAIILVASCSTMTSTRVGKSQPNLNNSYWKLADQVKGKTPTLVVEGAKLTGNSGCNNYFGELNIDPTAGNFSVKNIGSTRMSCENMDVENTFLKMLGETDHYFVEGNVLELYKGNLLLMKLVKM